MEGESGGEINQCAVLQELVDTQRRFIRDHKGRNYRPNSHQTLTHVPVNQDEPAGRETRVSSVGPVE